MITATLALLLAFTAAPEQREIDRRALAGSFVRSDCAGRDNPPDCIEEALAERLNSVPDRCDPAYHHATGWEFYADDRPSCPNLLRAEMHRRICAWPISRLADLPEFRRWGENRRDRMVRAAIEKANSCD